MGIMKKQSAFTVLIAILYALFIGFAMHTWGDALVDKEMGIWLVTLGILSVFLALRMHPFEKYIDIGIMWGGVLIVIYGIMRYWHNIPDDLQPVIIGALLVGVIYLGNKYKKYIK